MPVNRKRSCLERIFAPRKSFRRFGPRTPPRAGSLSQTSRRSSTSLSNPTAGSWATSSCSHCGFSVRSGFIRVSKTSSPSRNSTATGSARPFESAAARPVAEMTCTSKENAAFNVSGRCARASSISALVSPCGAPISSPAYSSWNKDMPSNGGGGATVAISLTVGTVVVEAAAAAAAAAVAVWPPIEVSPRARAEAAADPTVGPGQPVVAHPGHPSALPPQLFWLLRRRRRSPR